MAVEEVFYGFFTTGNEVIKTRLKLQILYSPFSIHWARLEPLMGRFWPPDLMFDTPVLEELQFLTFDE